MHRRRSELHLHHLRQLIEFEHIPGISIRDGNPEPDIL